MHLLRFPTEIRLQIYPELLSSHKPVNFRTCINPHEGTRRSLLPIQDRPQAFHPAILRTCKQIHAEATSFLYSHNCFRFPDISTRRPIPGYPDIAPHIAPFLSQIGASNARLLQHVSVQFPRQLADRGGPGDRTLNDAWISALELLCRTCLGLRTLELRSCDEDLLIGPVSIRTEAKAVKLLQEGGLWGIPKLERVVVCHSTEEEDDEEVAMQDRVLKKWVRKLGGEKWSAQVTKMQ